jgi:hypothetical protein
MLGDQSSVGIGVGSSKSGQAVHRRVLRAALHEIKMSALLNYPADRPDADSWEKKKGKPE